MTRRRRWLLAFALTLILRSHVIAGEDAERRERGEPTYKSPVVTLLLLPVTLLIRVARVFEPERERSGGRDAEPGEGNR
jgi:hypothetical protein